MSYTHFPHGASSFGCPLPSNPRFYLNGKKHWWVQGNTGKDSNFGDTPEQPLKTMAQAFVRVRSGDVIHFTGNIREQLSTPVGIFDVTIIGEGPIRHADAHTGNNGYGAATWKPPAAPVATTPLLKIQQQGWRLFNILFQPVTDNPAVLLFRNGGAGDLERDASHAIIEGCRFDAGKEGIQDSGGCAFVKIYNNLFRGQTTTSIDAVAGAGIGTLLCWHIAGNRFDGSVNSVILGLNESVVERNTFGKFTTKSLDLTGGTGNNVIWQNYFFGTYSVGGGYIKANANDEWAGNYNSGGQTTSDPA